MLLWAFVFLVLAVIFGALGFRSAAAVFGCIAKALFLIFLVLFVILLISAIFGWGTAY
jgi:uncharacterized membrane protein YtjA (UPF0391 family)